MKPEWCGGLRAKKIFLWHFQCIFRKRKKKKKILEWSPLSFGETSEFRDSHQNQTSKNNKEHWNAMNVYERGKTDTWGDQTSLLKNRAVGSVGSHAASIPQSGLRWCFSSNELCALCLQPFNSSILQKDHSKRVSTFPVQSVGNCYVMNFIIGINGNCDLVINFHSPLLVPFSKQVLFWYKSSCKSAGTVHMMAG